MKRGAAFCRFEATFVAPVSDSRGYNKSSEQTIHQKAQKQLADIVWNTLPEKGMGGGATLTDLRAYLGQYKRVTFQQLRPAVLLEALQHLQFAGLVGSTANQPLDDLAHRRYWRIRTF